MRRRSYLLLATASLLLTFLIVFLAQGENSHPDTSSRYDPAVFIGMFQATATRTPTPVNFGNFVWDDIDHDGRQDAGEPGLAGVTVQLWNSTKTDLIASTITNASGFYTLQSAGPGNFRIRVLLPGGSDQFSPKDNVSAGDLLDSDINPTGTNFGFTDIYVIGSNVISITSIDVGIIKFRTPTPTRTPTPVNFGNFVWDDLDQDGRQDAGEPGLAGVTVQLWNSTKTDMIASTLTNSNGNYTLQSSGPGNFRIRVLLPGGSDQFSPKDNVSAGDLLDSDINPTGTNFGFTDIYVIGSNVISITSIDVGIIKFRTPTPTRTPTPINLGNFVWNDLDQDGRQDAGEPGINGVTVQLWNGLATNLLSSTTTNVNGNYTLIAPLPGTYRVRFVLPSGATFSPKDVGDNNLDSDANVTGLVGYTDQISIASNVISITNIDAGMRNLPATQTYTPSSTATFTFTPTNTATQTPTPTAITIGNFVWDDLDQDGVQDAGEPGLGGVLVELWNGSKTTLLGTTTTDVSGFYTLTAPGPGGYRLRVQLPEGGDQFTLKNVGSDTFDSDIDQIGANAGFTDVYNFASGTTTVTNIDAGIIQLTPPTATLSPTLTNTLDPAFSATPDLGFTATFTPSEEPDFSITDTPTEVSAISFTDTPTATASATQIPDGVVGAPTPPDTPRCDLRGSETGDVVRAGVRPEFDLFCRTLVQYGQYVTYFSWEITGAGNVGNEGLLNMGIWQAVDMFSPSGQMYFEGGYVACLLGQGTLVWLDASTAPRVPQIIGSYTVPEWPGYTCATLFTPGTLVLVHSVDTAQPNPPPASAAAAATPVPNGCGPETTVVIAPGQTLINIAITYGTTVTAIRQANNISNPNLIFVGQTLVIPCAA